MFSIMPGVRGGPAVYDQERTTPYYYSVRFDESQIQTEFSPTERCGYFRFTFPHGNASVELSNRQIGNLQAQGPGASGWEEQFSNMKAFVYGEFHYLPVTFKTEAKAAGEAADRYEPRSQRRRVPLWHFFHQR